MPENLCQNSTSKRNVEIFCIKHVCAHLGGDHSFCEFWERSAFDILMSYGAGWAGLEERSGQQWRTLTDPHSNPLSVELACCFTSQNMSHFRYLICHADVFSTTFCPLIDGVRSFFISLRPRWTDYIICELQQQPLSHPDTMVVTPLCHDTVHRKPGNNTTMHTKVSHCIQ